MAAQAWPGVALIPGMLCPGCGAALSVYSDSWRCNACGLTSDTLHKIAEELRGQRGAAASPESDQGDFALLKGKQYVNFDIARRYLGIGRRAVEKAVAKGSLTAIGCGQGRRITVDSLRLYLPPSKNAN